MHRHDCRSSRSRLFLCFPPSQPERTYTTSYTVDAKTERGMPKELAVRGIWPRAPNAVIPQVSTHLRDSTCFPQLVPPSTPPLFALADRKEKRRDLDPVNRQDHRGPIATERIMPRSSPMSCPATSSNRTRQAVTFVAPQVKTQSQAVTTCPSLDVLPEPQIATSDSVDSAAPRNLPCPSFNGLLSARPPLQVRWTPPPAELNVLVWPCHRDRDGVCSWHARSFSGDGLTPIE